jgi:hypothetical protein
MWLKVYFWIYTILTVLGVLVYLPHLFTFNFATWEGLLESAALITGTYVYVYKKHVITNVWKPIFFLMLSVCIIQLLLYSNVIPSLTPYLKFLETSIEQDFGTLIITIILSLPAYYAIYRLAFQKIVK